MYYLQHKLERRFWNTGVIGMVTCNQPTTLIPLKEMGTYFGHTAQSINGQLGVHTSNAHEFSFSVSAFLA